MPADDIARVLELNSNAFADRVLALLRDASPTELFIDGPNAQDALAMLRQRRDLMIAIDAW